jgi:(R,R)-butanediol dehydrogenase/meso-butanediol dehydrogenase/diacetyl reductase
MLAAVLKEAGRLAVEEVPTPEPEAGELLVRVRDCGICGSDLHAAAMLPPGTVMGHEFSGEVAALGSGVRDWSVGERVVSLPFMTCGRCASCRAGDGIHCLEIRSIGLGQLPGAYAEYVRVQPANCLRLPDALDFRTGALVEPLAVALRGVRMAPVGSGTACLVLGAGPIGLTTLLWCKSLGATVVVSDPSEGRAALASRLGAAASVRPTHENPVSRVQAVAGREPEVVFECVGVRGTLGEAIGFAALHGTVVVLGVCMGADEIYPGIGVMKELTVRFALGYSQSEFAEALDALRHERLAVAPLVTDVVGIEDAPRAFEALGRPASQGKVLIEFR